MKPSRPAPVVPTRQRLLDAATRVFARHGLAGATTRAIAQEAGVNEVTLFRHFQSKDRLLSAVVGQNFGPAPARAETFSPTTDDLRADLLGLAHQHDKLLQENLPLIRTMIGEIHHHHREQERQVFLGVFRPSKEAILHRLRLAQAAGELAEAIPAAVLTDLFVGMIFTGVLRRCSTHAKVEYPAASYLQSAVDLVLHGAAPRAAS